MPTADAPAAHSALFSSSDRTTIERPGITVWLVAAIALAAGILIGFASGYRAARTVPASSQPIASSAGSAATGSAPATDGQAFSEAAVREPIRIEEQPVVPTPAIEPKPAAPSPAPAPKRAATPLPPKRAAAVQASRKNAAPAPSGPGSLQVVSHPSGAQVLVDGKLIGRTPLGVPDVSAGAHNVRLQLPGFKGWATMVDVAAGNRTRVAASLEQQ